MWQGWCSASVFGNTQYKGDLVAVLDTSHYTFALQSKVLAYEVFTNIVTLLKGDLPLLDVPLFMLVYPEYTDLAKCWAKTNHESERGFRSLN